MGSRIRRHVDPLQCRVAVGIDDWLRAYRAGGEGDIWLDLGCGKGELLWELAVMHPSVFFIGIEIRRRIADRFFPKYRNLKNLTLLHGNVNLSIPSMMGGRKVRRVLIHFPDPFDHKARYKKRQMVNEGLVDGLCDILAPDGAVSVKTDRKSYFEEMEGLFLSRMEPYEPLPPAPPHARCALSEWEAECLRHSIPVFSGEYRPRR